MTDAAYDEIRAIRARLAELEGRLAPAPKEEEANPMYRYNDEPAEERRVRQLGELWKHDPGLEHLLGQLEREPELRIDPSQRMALGSYKEGRAHAKAIGRRTDGREGVRLDTTGDRS